MTKFIGRKNNQVSTNAQLGGMAFQDSSNAAVGNIDIESISGSPNIKGFDKNVYDTALDVFVYDTSKDSDGGAWRKRTTHTSWYNETLNTSTRGSRREFPAVAVIVSESSRVVIYDGDDPDLPMWMVFNGTSTWNQGLYYNANTSGPLYALNGITAWGDENSAFGLITIDFIKEFSTARTTGSAYGGFSSVPLVNRNSTRAATFSANTYTHTAGNLVGNLIYDVAMTVLPNAPIDSATGLPVPTIAVGTNTGSSVVTDSGNVYDITGFAPTRQTGFSGDKLLIHTLNGTTSYFAVGRRELTADIGLNDWEYGDQFDNGKLSSGRALPASMGVAVINATNEVSLGGAAGVFKVQTDDRVETNGDGSNLKCGITSYYNTGWQPGLIRGAFLAETDATNVTAGSNLIPASSADFSSSSGWTLATGWTISGGKLNKTTTDNNTASYLVSGLTAGKAYTFSIDVDTVPSSGAIYFYALGQYTIWQSLATTGTHSLTFVATSTSHYVGITGVSGNGCVLDNASVTVGEADRSLNNRGFRVFGTITKSPVATGAELVAYSGWSSSNYLRQTYNSNLNFATGDFSIVVWVIKNNTTTQVVFEKGNGTSNRLYLYISASNDVRFSAGNVGTSAYGNISSATEWHQITIVRRSGTVYGYINGVLQASNSNPETVTGSNDDNFIVGKTISNLYPFSGSISLLRISGNAASPEQVKKMYEDEKVLFQENAACTLYGSSDTVTALAYDEVTDRLYAGTSYGRSDFQGLRRINNTTTAVSTAISAHDGLIAQQ